MIEFFRSSNLALTCHTYVPIRAARLIANPTTATSLSALIPLHDSQLLSEEMIIATSLFKVHYGHCPLHSFRRDLSISERELEVMCEMNLLHLHYVQTDSQRQTKYRTFLGVPSFV